MPIPFRLEYVIEKTATDASTEEQKLISQFTGRRLPAPEARTIWSQILDHKWFISECLGRDVGLRVAVIDYFENIRSRSSERSMCNC